MLMEGLDAAQIERYAGILRDVLQHEQQGSLEELDLVVLITAISARRGLLPAVFRTPGEITRAVLGPHGTAGALDPATYARRVQEARDTLALAELLTTAREGLLRRGQAYQDINYLASILGLALLPHQAADEAPQSSRKEWP